MPRIYLNNFTATLANNIGTGATTMEMSAADAAALVPAPGAGVIYRMSLFQGTTKEIVDVTNMTGTDPKVLTITRAVEDIAGVGRVAQAFTAGAVIANRITVGTFADLGSPSSFGLFSNVAGYYVRGNASDLNGSIGNPNGSNNGTATGRAYSNSIFGSQTRLGFVSAAAINSPAGRTFIGHGYTAATEANTPGLLFRAGVGISDASFQSTASLFVGLTTSGASVGDPASLTTNACVGIGCSPADTTLSLYHSNGGGSVTKVSLGAGFPCNTTGVDWYDIELIRNPGSYQWSYRVRNATTGAVISGTVTTNLPATAGAPNWHICRNTLAGTAAVGVDLSHLVVAVGSGIGF